MSGLFIVGTIAQIHGKPGIEYCVSIPLTNASDLSDNGVPLSISEKPLETLLMSTLLFFYQNSSKMLSKTMARLFTVDVVIRVGVVIVGVVEEIRLGSVSRSSRGSRCSLADRRIIVGLASRRILLICHLCLLWVGVGVAGISILLSLSVAVLILLSLSITVRILLSLCILLPLGVAVGIL